MRMSFFSLVLLPGLGYLRFRTWWLFISSCGFAARIGLSTFLYTLDVDFFVYYIQIAA